MTPFLTSILGSAAGGIVNAITGSAAHRRDRKEALEDWHRQNEYNSPKAQMQRFKEAGLNPNLIYGQGTPGNASATPVSQQKSGNPTHRMDLQAVYGEAKRLEANMQQVQQTVENLKKNNELMAANIELSNQLREQREQEFPLKLSEKDARISSLESSTTYRNKMLQPTLDTLTLKNYLAGRKDKREERLLSSTLLLNNSKQQQTIAQTALTTQLRLKAVQDTISRANANQYQKSLLQEALYKIQAETDNIIQNRRTSMSVEQLNKITSELKAYEEQYAPIDKSLSILERILKPFKK